MDRLMARPTGGFSPNGSSAHELLRDLPILKYLPADVGTLVMESFVPASYAFGASIVQEGEDADALFVLVNGRARIVKKGESGEEIALNQLRAGDTFGEMGLIEHATRQATVRAMGDVEVLRLDRGVFDALLRSRPEVRQYFELQTRHRHLHNFFREFTAFARLPGDALQMMLEQLGTVTVEPGQMVIEEGDPPGSMYLVEDGRLRVFTTENGGRHYLSYLRKGDFFGELSIFKSVNRSASVEAVSRCTLLELRADTYQQLLARYPVFRAQIEQRISQYDYKHTARVPLDFAEELLPAETSTFEKVSLDQVDRLVGAAEPGGRAGAAPDETPFADDAGHFVKFGRKRIRRFPHVWQVDEMDCGAASLAMVCRHYGRPVSLARIRQLVHTSLDGTSLRAISRAAQELGLAARSVKASPRNLEQMPLPAIVHWHGNHWVVLYDVTETHVRIADPATGLQRVPRAEFHEKWSGFAALFDYTTAFEQAPVQKIGITWLWPFFRPYARWVLQSAALALMVSALELVLPVFTQVIVDRVVVESDVSLLNLLVIAMIGILAFTMVGMIIQRYLLSFVAVRIDSSTLDFLTRRLLSLPMSYFSTRRTGDIQRRLAGIWQVREFLVSHGVAGLSAVAQLLVALGLMFVYSPLLTVVFLATTPIYVLLVRFSMTRLLPLYAELEDTYGKYQSFQIDAIKGIETVKALGAEGNFRELMLNEFNAVARRRFRADFLTMSYDGTIHTIAALSVALFLWVGALQVMHGALSIGALVAFNSLVALANVPIFTLLMMFDNLQQATVYLNRLDDVFQQEPEQGMDRSRLTPVRTLEGRLSLRKLGFRYGGSEAPAILQDITVEIEPDTMVAIVGRSGSGKTTLIKCLAGLLEPTEGTILYDGIDLKTLNYRDLRRKIGFVLQENHLFDDTIARNIAFGEEEPDLDAVIWASRAANAHEFVERLPLGYETRIGESGLGLSGGQRQRIAIARAVFNRPPILIFDEATSALDSESERAVKENIDQLLEGRTSFVIAHRLSTVRDADLILVLEKGRLVERGTHDQLMDAKGLYFYLVSQQLGL
jgi:HlyB family type I secretion system ABC transporter